MLLITHAPIPSHPVRTCMGCGDRAPQGTLLRIESGAGGGLRLRLRASISTGRSGYLHPRQVCLDKFATRKGPLRSLRRSIDRDTRRSFVASIALTGSESEEGLGLR